jgi:hypothetical protein
VLARRLTPVLAATLVVGLAASGCASQAVGVRVGDRTYSQADMVDELDAYGHNDALWRSSGQGVSAIQGELGDSYSQDFVSDLVQQRITFMLAEQLFDEHHLRLTDGDRSTAEGQLAGQIGQDAVDQFPADYHDQLVDDLGRLNRVAQELGEDELNSAMIDKAHSNEIEVSPKFGRWDEDQLQVVPPDGSTPAPGSGSASASASGSSSGSGSGSGPSSGSSG